MASPSPADVYQLVASADPGEHGGTRLAGRLAIGPYLGNSAPASAFGAAGCSLAALLLWVYYSAHLLGAALTRLFIARRRR